MRVFIYSNETDGAQLFEGQTDGVSGKELVVAAPSGTGGLTRNATYKYSLGAPNLDTKTATLTNVEGLKYTFSVS